MKKFIGTLTFAAALALVSCGNVTPAAEVSQTATEATTTVQVSTEPTTSTDMMKLIGDRAAGNSVYILTLDNKTGKDIKSVTIKADSEEEYPANMIDENDPYIKNERRLLYYVPNKVSDVTYGDSDMIATVGYTVKMEFTDNKTAVLHNFPFGDIDEGEIKLEKDIAYLEYTSKESGQKVSTKESEKAIAENDAENDTESVSEVNPEANNNIDAQYVDEPVYTPPVNQEPVYTPPVNQEPVYTPPVNQEPVVTPEPTQAQAEDPNGGCLSGGGGALTW